MTSPVVQALHRGWKWSRPRAVTLLRRTTRVVHQSSLVALRWTWRHRAAVLAVAARLGWWLSLAVLGWGMTRLFDVHRPLQPELLLRVFATGAALCSLPLVAARGRPLRWSAWVLGTLHGMAGILTWVACFE